MPYFSVDDGYVCLLEASMEHKRRLVLIHPKERESRIHNSCY